MHTRKDQKKYDIVGIREFLCFIFLHLLKSLIFFPIYLAASTPRTDRSSRRPPSLHQTPGQQLSPLLVCPSLRTPHFLLGNICSVICLNFVKSGIQFKNWYTLLHSLSNSPSHTAGALQVLTDPPGKGISNILRSELTNLLKVGCKKWSKNSSK